MAPIRLAPLAALMMALAPVSAHADELAGTTDAILASDSGALTDAELADVHGRGSPRGAFLRVTTREQLETFDQQNGALLPVTFANWFNDVGSVLIWNNVLAAR